MTCKEGGGYVGATSVVPGSQETPTNGGDGCPSDALGKRVYRPRTGRLWLLYQLDTARWSSTTGNDKPAWNKTRSPCHRFCGSGRGPHLLAGCQLGLSSAPGGLCLVLASAPPSGGSDGTQDPCHVWPPSVPAGGSSLLVKHAIGLGSS